MENNFVKDDKGKLQFSLLDYPYIFGTTKALMYGATKYGVDNWKLCPDLTRYKDALLRHILAYLSGERIDIESGLSHLYLASCNLMFLNYFDMKKDEDISTKS